MGLNIEKLVNFIKKYENLFSYLILVIIFFTTFSVYYKLMGPFLIDYGREYIVPKSMNEGMVLYKDIACIYTPLAFQLNALLFKIFGASLDLLWASGVCTALIILFTIFNIAKMFTSTIVSLVLCSFCVVVLMINPSLFNYIYPYSFSCTYGLACYMLGAYFVLKYLKNSESMTNLYVASFFASLAIDFKSEFITLTLIIYIALVVTKNFKLKYFIFLSCIFLLFPLVSFLSLYLQGLHFSEISIAYKYMTDIISSDTSIWYQKRNGMLFVGSKFIEGCFWLFCTVLLFVALFFIYNYKVKNKILLLPKIVILVYSICFLQFYILSKSKPVTIALILCCLFFIKFLKTKKELLFLFLLSIGVSIRTFFLSNSFCSYGVFYTPLFLITIFSFLIMYFKDKYPDYHENMKSYIVLFLSILTICFFIQTNPYNALRELSYIPYYKVKTRYGSVRTLNEYGLAVQNICNFIMKYTPENSKLLVIPEGEMINVLTNRKSDMMLYSLNQMFLEGYGEDYVVNRIKSEKIDYIVYYSGFDFFNYGKSYYYPKLLKLLDENYQKIYVVQHGTTLYNVSRMFLYKIKSN